MVFRGGGVFLIYQLDRVGQIGTDGLMKAMISSDKSPNIFAYVYCFCDFLSNVGFELLWCFICFDFSFLSILYIAILNISHT